MITRWEIPTQNCVLSHVTTQMKAMRKGAPVGLMFQSLAGSQKGNDSFGITVGLLDEAYALAKKHCVADRARTSCTSRPGRARRCPPTRTTAPTSSPWRRAATAWRGATSRSWSTPSSGFIGPEYLYDARQITRAGLEDHFMGKLIGLPMGCDACYTNHARADQNDLENLAVLLGAAGCNYLMGIPMGDDAMLNYQSPRFHDAATLRQLLRLRPAPEFEAWLEGLGLIRDGQLTEKAGDASFFLSR